jgi:pimeloyl-ACP methyl ester carboxylesterase
MRSIIVVFTAALLAATPSLARTELRQLERSDGSTIHYSVDVPDGEPAGTIVLAQGSGCLPTASGTNWAKVRNAFPNHVAVMVEKYGINPDAQIVDGYRDCPDEFHAGYTASQRVTDYEAVIAELDALKPLVLFGGSEGGLAVAMLSARIHPEATIILSSALGIPFAEMVIATVPPEGKEHVRAGLAAAAADPEGSTLFAGFSHRFWADIMDHVVLDHMLQSDSQFLVIQGGLDKSSPVAAARATADRFAAEERCDLTYWEFPALDHGMLDPSGRSHMAEIAAAAAAWAADPVTC